MKHSIDFAITSYCQAKCRSCARTNEQTGEVAEWITPTHMSLDNFKKLLESSQISKSIDVIEFCGEVGDPLMHPQISEFIDTALLYTDKLWINTNGGLRNPDWYTEYANKYPPGETGKKITMHFGIDGTDHDTNWMYREGVDWQRAMDNMSAWFKNYGHGEWHFLIFDWNWNQIPAAKQMADQIGCRIVFKMNNRSFGKITQENKKIAYRLLEECDGL